MSALDQKRPTQSEGESWNDYRKRSRHDYKFDPGIGDGNPTDFKEALKPRIAPLVAQTGKGMNVPLNYTRGTMMTAGGMFAPWLAQSISDAMPKQKNIGLASSIQDIMPTAMFGDVNDDGLNFSAMLPDAGGSLFSQFETQRGVGGRTQPGIGRTLSSRYQTPGSATPRSFTPFARRKQTTLAQQSGLPY